VKTKHVSAEATKPPQVRPKTAKQRRRQAFQRGLEEAQRTEKRVRAQVAQNFSRFEE
jgi:hypothetical protein